MFVSVCMNVMCRKNMYEYGGRIVVRSNNEYSIDIRFSLQPPSFPHIL